MAAEIILFIGFSIYLGAKAFKHGKTTADEASNAEEDKQVII